MRGWRVGLAALDRAIEALVSFLEANVVSQLVTVGVELAYFPLGLQGIRVGDRGAQPRVQVAPEPPHHLAALPLGHEGCTTSAGFSTAGLCICWTSQAEAECGHSQQGKDHQGPHGGSVLSGSVSSCCWVSAGLPLTVSTLYTLGRALEARGGTHHACCGRATGRSARAIWESSALALDAKSQRMWLEPQLPGQVWPHCKAYTPNRPAPVSVETPARQARRGRTGAWGERGAQGLK